jgi:KaiC/GvpD/RAD55 family RecA-like ATPase
MEKHYFAGAITPFGFSGFFDRLISGYNLQKLYILKGGSGLGKSTFMKKFAENFASNNNHNIDYIHCSSDPDSLDGVVIVDLGIGMIDGTYPHIVDPAYPGIVDEIVNLGEYIIKDRVKATRDKLDELTNQKREYNKTAVENLYKARQMHIEIESLYSDAVDFEGVDKRLQQIINENNIL